MDEKNQMDKEEIIKKFNAEIDEVRMGLMDVLKKNEYNPIIILSYGREKTQIFRSEMNRSSCF